MKRLLLTLLLSAGMLSAQNAAADEGDPIHQQLRETRKQIITAIETRDINAMLSHVHPDIVTTWQDGQCTHGITELRAFYDRIGKGAFVSFKVPHQPDGLSIIHGGDTAISTGKVVANYHLLGRDYEFTSRWTATLVLKDGNWLVAAYHVSLNALDNPILNTAESSLWIAGLAGLVLGVILTILVKRLRRRNR